MGDHKLTLLAYAKKAGKPVHPGLRMSGFEWIQKCDDPKCYKKKQHKHLVWTDNVPNPDPMALISAAQAKGWYVKFIQDKVGPHPEMYYVQFSNPNKRYHYARGYGPDNHSALTDALFQATETLTPSNWEQCKWCKGKGYIRVRPPNADRGCDHCHEIGIILV